MKTIKIMLAVFLSTGCLAQTVDPTPDTEPCPVVECAWLKAERTACSAADAYTNSVDTYEEGSGLDAVTCQHYSSSCTPAGTRPECVPAECFLEFYTCQPSVVLGGPNPGAAR